MDLFEKGRTGAGSYLRLNRPYGGGHKSPETNEFENRIADVWPNEFAACAAVRDWANKEGKPELRAEAIRVVKDNLSRRTSPINVFREIRELFDRHQKRG